jgi:hypothetical protein
MTMSWERASGGLGLRLLLRLSKKRLLGGCRKMSIPQAFLRDEIPRNEAYREVRRSDEG